MSLAIFVVIVLLLVAISLAVVSGEGQDLEGHWNGDGWWAMPEPDSSGKSGKGSKGSKSGSGDSWWSHQEEHVPWAPPAWPQTKPDLSGKSSKGSKGSKSSESSGGEWVWVWVPPKWGHPNDNAWGWSEPEPESEPSGKSGKSGGSKSRKLKCLEAVMKPSNPDDVTGAFAFPNVEGTVTVCFDSSTKTWGTLVIDVMNLRPSITGVITGGGVHVHNGTSCTSTTTQGGHYWKPSQYGIKKDGDPWYPQSTEIAPTGTWYNTDSMGNAEREFRFDQGYGYDLTVGKVIVIHDANTTASGYKRVACGKLKAA